MYTPFLSKSIGIWIFFVACVLLWAPAYLPCMLLVLQEKLNKEAVLGKVIGAVMGKKEGENVVNITTTVNMLPIFWEAEKASFFSFLGKFIVSIICLNALHIVLGLNTFINYYIYGKLF